MYGRLGVLAAVAGAVAVHARSALPTPGDLWLGLAVVVVMLLLAGLAISRYAPRRIGLKRALLVAVCLVMGFYLGFGITFIAAQQRLQQHLAVHNVDKVSRVTLRVLGLPSYQAGRLNFQAQVLESRPSGVPELIQVAWGTAGWRGPYARPQAIEPLLASVKAGQVWRMALVLKPVHGQRNYAGFDYEGYAFASGIRALGTVRGQPEFLYEQPFANLSLIADRARHGLRQAMQKHLEGKKHSAIILALSIGDRADMSAADWQVFNRSGLTHLVSISGTHITMLAGSCALFLAFIWRRLRWRGRILAERWPARQAAGWAALLVAFLYSLLAGWGVPAQRSFLMLAVVALALILQIRLSASRILALAALVVLLMNPWSVHSNGFWLSFLAVAVLVAINDRYAGTRVQGKKSGLKSKIFFAARLQMAINLALLVPLAYLFHEVPWVAPLANTYAIPMVELLITPLALLLALCAQAPALDGFTALLAWLANQLIAVMMLPTSWLASLPGLLVPAAPVYLYVVAGAGAVLALWPAGLAHIKNQRLAALLQKLPKRGWGWCALVPLLLYAPARPAPGAWDLYALDVGQGSAILLVTAHHSLLFDAGARRGPDADEGLKTVVPLLKALGLKRLDVLVASHADLDHSGGVRSVLQAITVEQSYSSFDLDLWLSNEARKLRLDTSPAATAASACVFGGHWEVDGVSFEFLWPLDKQAQRQASASNAASCVLRVRGAFHSALLTGDIDQGTEATLVARGLGAVDLVVAAHHGSRSSSAAVFTTATRPKHVLMQLGRWNRHGHPNADVVRRWQDAGAKIWRTDYQGGVNASSRAQGLSLYSVHESSRRYWHAARP